MTIESHNITSEKIINKNEDSCLLEFTIPANCDFFDGHFPEIKLVPAVAQIDMVINLAKKYFNTASYIVSAKRVKFTSPVRPDSTVHLSIKYNSEKESITYKLTTQDEAKAYSSGTLSLAKNEKW